MATDMATDMANTRELATTDGGPFGTTTNEPMVQPQDPQTLYARNQTALDERGEREMFPNFGGPLMVYSKDVMGEAFTFLSGVTFVVQPEKILSNGGKIGEQEVARVWVAIWDWEKHEYQPAKLASFSDTFLVNQLRGVSAENLVNSGLYTVARNDRFATAGGDWPRMLKRYVYGTDNPLNELRYQADKAQRTSVNKATIPADTKSLFGGRVPTDWTGPNGQLSRTLPDHSHDEDMTQAERNKAEIARVQALANEDAGEAPWIAAGTVPLRPPTPEALGKRGPGRPKGSTNKPK